MEISMNEILKDHKYASNNKEGLYIVLRGTSPKARGRFVYITFLIGEDIVDQMGLRAKDYVNFVWDTEKKTGFLETATSTTGRIVYRNTKKSSKLLVSYPIVGNFGLPIPKKRTELLNVKTKKGKVSFLYEGEVQSNG